MKTFCASSVFQVSNLAASIQFYTEALGFDEEFIYGEPAYYAGVKLGEVIIHLNTSTGSNDRLGKGALYIFCDEVDAFYAKLTARNVTITSALNSYPYGMRDFQIKDIDGNLLCFGCAVDQEN
jgi:uncharacterized glyoxalase superfamily protein PhnB